MITVVDYDPAWPGRFEELRAVYSRALRARGIPHRIEHVGSTAVPGLAAKPVIDIDIVVADRNVDKASEALVGLGFTPLGDLGIPQRHAFEAPGRLAATNTYIVVEGSLSLRNHLAVRDVLRADAALREEYAEVKRRSAVTAAGIDEYIMLKSDVLQRILTLGGIAEEERAAVEAVNRGATNHDPRG